MSRFMLGVMYVTTRRPRELAVGTLTSQSVLNKDPALISYKRRGDALPSVECHVSYSPFRVTTC